MKEKNPALVYLDTSSGLVPAKLVHVGNDFGGEYARVKITATRGGYKRGETFAVSPSRVARRDSLRREGRKTYFTPVSDTVLAQFRESAA